MSTGPHAPHPLDAPAGGVDVAVVGAGPAGLAAAAGCRREGLDVAVVDPQMERTWGHTLGVWTDEIAGLDLDPRVYRDRWPAVQVDLGLGPVVLSRAYARFDNTVLQRVLRDRAAGARFLTCRATGVRTGPDHVEVDLSKGSALRARVVVDASGHRPVLLPPEPGPPAAWQTAFGIEARLSGGRPFDGAGVLLMDHRPSGSARPPSFLYGMRSEDDWWLLEETCLAARPAVATSLLRDRLWGRLRGLGIEVSQVRGEERVRFPMGGPLPGPDRGVVGFGAAGGMVHPATGYQVGAALSRAPVLARALATALASGPVDPVEIAAAVWRAVWPRRRRQVRLLHLLGLEALLAMDQEQTRRFFAAFFELRQQRWRPYLSGDRPGAVLQTMGAVFRRLEPSMKALVVRGVVDGATRQVRHTAR